MRDVLRESQNGLSKRQGDSGDPVPVLRLANVVNGAIDESDAREIRLTDNEVAKYALEPGDLLCIRVNGSRNLVGRLIPFVAQRRWAYCDHFIRLRPDQARVDSRYLAHYLDTRVARREIEVNMVSSAGQSTVSQGTMLDLHVPLPDLPRQKAIVAELEKQFSRLDEAVANLQRVKANLKRQRAAVLASAARGELLPGSRAFGSIPLADLCGDGLVVDGDWVESKDQDPTGDVRLVQLADVGDGEFRNKSARFLTREKARSLGCTFLEAGDLLVARMPDPLGRACIFPGDAKDCVTVVDVCIIRPNTERVDPRWLMHSINAPQVRRQVAALEAGSTRKRISRKKLATVVVPEVQKPIQRQIAADVDRRLSFVREVEREVDANLRRAQVLRQSVLMSAFGLGGEHA
jgi:restriction endonuclease S subunit